MKTLFPLLMALTFCAPSLSALERRRDPFRYEFSYYAYPIVQDIPGLGTASGVGANLVDIGGTDLDFGGFYLDGEFMARGAYFLNQHLLEKLLVLDLGFFDYDVATLSFDRGIESAQDQYILPQVTGAGYQGQVTLMLFDRMVEGYYRKRFENYKVKAVFNADGSEFQNIDNSKQQFDDVTLGLRLDYTDDRQDPRAGLRYEWLKKIPVNTDDLISNFYVIDQNLSAYIPVGKLSTWAFNAYQSQSVVTEMAETDTTKLRDLIGLGCQAIPDPWAQGACLATETKRVEDRSVFNQYGRATPLGGTQRLRSYPNGRFNAGAARFYGTEFRLNLNEESTPFDYIIMKGVRTNLQLAAFWETGTVAETVAELSNATYKSSYGVGFRIIFEGVTVRADYATGEEGGQSTLFIDYPWGLSAIDNSTR